MGGRGQIGDNNARWCLQGSGQLPARHGSTQPLSAGCSEEELGSKPSGGGGPVWGQFSFNPFPPGDRWPMGPASLLASQGGVTGLIRLDEYARAS